jgi:ubiquinone/menaquinone biosynthesis C-methylase UbiE
MWLQYVARHTLQNKPFADVFRNDLKTQGLSRKSGVGSLRTWCCCGYANERRRFLWSLGCFLTFSCASGVLGAHGGEASGSATKSSRPLYDQWASTYDALNDRNCITKLSGLDKARELAISYTFGRVLEIGFGTGISLRSFIQREKDHQSQASRPLKPLVQSIVGLDASSEMLQTARERAFRLDEDLPFELRLVHADLLAALPFEEEAFDCVLCAYTLCTMPDLDAALRTALRLVRPGGRLILLDHVRSNAKLIAAYQDVVAPLVQRTAKDCRWNRDLERALDENLEGSYHILESRRFLGGTVELLVAERLGRT